MRIVCAFEMCDPLVVVVVVVAFDERNSLMQKRADYGRPRKRAKRNCGFRNWDIHLFSFCCVRFFLFIRSVGRSFFVDTFQ